MFFECTFVFKILKYDENTRTTFIGKYFIH